MTWIEACAIVSREDLERASALLFDLGSVGLQEEDGAPLQQIWEKGPAPPPSPLIRLRAFFEDPDRSAVEEALQRIGINVAWVEVIDADWDESWKQDYKPLRISERLVIAPPWNAPAGAIVIEPGQGFGTGEHPTTRMMLANLDALADEADVATVLDVGCGSGILALAAARLGLSAQGVDVDPDAVEEARENAERNALSVSFGVTPIAELDAPADLVLANLHAEIMIPLAHDLARLSRRHLVVCGILGADREERVRSAFPTLRLAARETSGEWVCLRFCAQSAP